MYASFHAPNSLVIALVIGIIFYCLWQIIKTTWFTKTDLPNPPTPPIIPITPTPDPPIIDSTTDPITDPTTNPTTDPTTDPPNPQLPPNITPKEIELITQDLNNINDVCKDNNYCESYRINNIPGYTNVQYEIKCLGDADYSNTVLGAPDYWSYYKAYDPATYTQYPNLQKAVQGYCKPGQLRYVQSLYVPKSIGTRPDLNNINDVCTADNNCDSYRMLNGNIEVKCIGDGDYSGKLYGTRGYWGYVDAYNDITNATYTDLQSAIKPFCAPGSQRFTPKLFIPPTPSGSPTNYNSISDTCTKDIYCDTYRMKSNNPAIYQFDIKCTNDDDYYNTIQGNAGQWGFEKGYDTTTFRQYSNIRSALIPYCSNRYFNN